MLRRGHAHNQIRIFSLTVGVILILGCLLTSISLQMPNATAGSSKNHNVGNVEINMLTDWGRILDPIKWKGDNKIQTVKDPAGLGFIGLVIDHDEYDHTPGAEDIADSFKTGPYYSSQDDLQTVNDITMITDDGITQKSFASFQNKGAGFPDDILINQTAWAVLNKDWAIIQWSLLNLKGVPLTNVSIGLELPLSVAGGYGGVGGDSGDDIDGFDTGNDTYWAQDDDGITIGFASAIPTESITHYYSEDYGNIYTWNEYKMLYENETWLYERLTAPNTTVGTTPGNRTTTLGWDNFSIGVGSIKTFTLVIAVNDSFENMNAAVRDAQLYFNYELCGFRITEFSDADSGTEQKVEVFNFGYEATDLYATGYFLSSDGGTTSENIPPEGGTIGLYYDDGGTYILVDEVSYGQEGLAPDPLAGESVARRYDSAKGDYTNDWLRNTSAGPTWGLINDVPPINFNSILVLNEIMFNPITPEDGFVELYLREGTLNISGYKIVSDTEYTIPDETVLTEDERFFYLTYTMNQSFFDSLNPFGDNIYLYDDNGTLLNMAGWSSSHAQGETMARIPSGNGTGDGFDDISSTAAGWRFDQFPSISLLLISPDCEKDNYRGQNTTYDLKITNNQDNDDLVDISNISGPWGWEVVILDENGAPLTDTNGNGLPDIFVPGRGYVTVRVVVIVPPDALGGENETTIVTAQSTFNPMLTDNATLITTVKVSSSPFQTVTFPADSYVIPFDDKQKDILKAFGFVHALLRNGSYIYRIIEPPNVTIRTAVFPLGMEFAGGPMLVMPYDAAIVNAVHANFPSVTYDITIGQFISDRVDIIVKPTKILIIYGDYGRTQDVLSNMEIPYTMVTTTDVENDPDMLFNYDLIVDDCPGWRGSVPYAVASNMQLLAESGGELVFTDIALMDLGAVFPGHIPITDNVGGTWPCSVHLIPEFPGQYYGPPVLDIYTMGSGKIMKTPTKWDVRIMVDSDNYDGNYRVLAAYFFVGSDIDNLGIVEGFAFHPGDQPPDASILASMFFGNKFVHIPPLPDLPDHIPPELYISAVGDDIILNWTPPKVPEVSNYLIYRSTSQTGFDFSDIWVDTSLHDDNGIMPLRTTWNDTGAASDSAPQEYYYIIRTVLDSGKISSTSRTVGKWTKTFHTSSMNAEYIKYMNTTTHIWMQHNFGDGNANNVEMKAGEGFEVKFSNPTTYTFTGMPGAMIMYDDDAGFLGFDYTTEAESLMVTVDVNGDVNLIWQEPGSMGAGDWYEVYYSNARDGFFGILDVDYFLVSGVDFGSNTASHVNAQANSPGARLYYMVVPFNATGVRGSSTYSIGIWTEEYLSQYDTIGIPLKLSGYPTADWYCNNIPDTVGINYYIYSEQRWSWHSTRMPEGAFDTVLEMGEGYQISTSSVTKFTFIGI
jgi:hypothetical protein